MKKVVLFIALVATTVVGAQAQKFQGGEKNLEVEFKPFGESPVAMPNGFRFRMFNSETSAIRVGFDIGGGNDTRVRTQQQPFTAGTTQITLPELYSATKSFNFAIRPGYEIHFAGTDRLSPYVGAELMYAMQSSSYSEEYHSGNTATTTAAAEAGKWVTWDVERKEGATSFGLNALAGVDFYFADNFYLGAEINLGFHNTKQKNSEISVSDESAYILAAPSGEGYVNSSFDQMLGVKEGKMTIATIIGDGTGTYTNSGWGPNFQSTLRLGWLF